LFPKIRHLSFLRLQRRLLAAGAWSSSSSSSSLRSKHRQWPQLSGNCRGAGRGCCNAGWEHRGIFFCLSAGLSGDYDSFERMLGTRHSSTRKLSTRNDGAVSAAACKLSTCNDSAVSLAVCKLSTHTDGAASVMACKLSAHNDGAGSAPRAATPLSAATCVAGLTAVGFFSASEPFTLPRQ
jgi:hypothetical protein